MATFNFTFPAANEPAFTATFTTAALTAMANNVLREVPPQGVFPNSPCVLASAVAPTDGTVTLNSAANASTLSPGYGLLIDSEVMSVVSISGAVVTTARGMVGTTAASHASGATVTALQYGSYGAQIKLMLERGFYAIAPAPAAFVPPVNPIA